MTEPAFIEFRLEDPNKSYQTVNVAGNFNNWNSTADQLKFDDESKSWLLDLAVEMCKNEKVVYKYITDNINWICDETKPRETDESGIENNITYVILKKDLTATKAVDVDDEDEIFDHKSFHEGELFESANLDINEAEESAPTSGDNFAPETDDLGNDTQVIASTKNLQSKDTTTEVPTEGIHPTSLWDSIKWFLRYYVFAWLFPTS